MDEDVSFNQWMDIAELCPAFPGGFESPGDEEGRGWSLGKAVVPSLCQSCPDWERLGRVFGSGTAADTLAVQAVIQDQDSRIQSEDCSAAGMKFRSTN